MSRRLGQIVNTLTLNRASRAYVTTKRERVNLRRMFLAVLLARVSCAYSSSIRESTFTSHS